MTHLLFSTFCQLHLLLHLLQGPRGAGGQNAADVSGEEEDMNEAREPCGSLNIY